MLDWLLEGDPAIRWQALRDLAGAAPDVWQAEQARVVAEGWGARLLVLQDPNGLWAGGLYIPKWTSTTYTLLLLRSFGLKPGHPAASKACLLLLDRGLWNDGGLKLWKVERSDTCVTGMGLSLAAWFLPDDDRSETLVAHLLAAQTADGGWNCRRWKGATHGSFHTTISVLEGLHDYVASVGRKHAAAIEAQARGREFLLQHRLFRSHRTGEIVHPAMTRFAFPPRWHYDVLRALDHFRACGAPREPRLEDAIALLHSRKRDGGRWPLQNRHPGKTFFELEKVGAPSRWNTLRALRVLTWWS